MKTLTVDEVTAHLADILESVKNGASVEITKGGDGQPVAMLVPPPPLRPGQTRKIGLLEGRAEAVFHDGWSMSDEEAFNS